jgi:hypothetical protein
VAIENMKVSSKIYKGIEYVQMNDLPDDQKEKFLESCGPESFIKILVGETVVRDCIQYKDYDFWFNSTFRRQVGHSKKEVTLREHPLQIALEKI